MPPPSTSEHLLTVLGILLAGCGGGLITTTHTSEPLAAPRLHVGPVQFMIPAGFTISTQVAKHSRYAALVDRLNRGFATCEHATEEDVQILMMPVPPDLATSFVEKMRDGYQDVVVHREELKSINGIDVDLLDFEGTETKGRARLIVCAIPSGDSSHVLMFVCPAVDATEWLPVAERVVNSIELRRQSIAQPADGSDAATPSEGEGRPEGEGE